MQSKPAGEVKHPGVPLITEDREDKQSEKGKCLKWDEWQNTHGIPVKLLGVS